MTIVTLDEVAKLAALSNLSLSNDEAEAMRSDIAKVLGYVQKLDELDLVDVPPTFQTPDPANVMAEDVVSTKDVPGSELVESAPDSKDGQIKVLKVL